MRREGTGVQKGAWKLCGAWQWQQQPTLVPIWWKAAPVSTPKRNNEQRRARTVNNAPNLCTPNRPGHLFRPLLPLSWPLHFTYPTPTQAMLFVLTAWPARIGFDAGERVRGRREKGREEGMSKGYGLRVMLRVEFRFWGHQRRFYSSVATSRAIPNAGNSQQLLICKICNETFPAVYPVYIVNRAGYAVCQGSCVYWKKLCYGYYLLPDII